MWKYNFNDKWPKNEKGQWLDAGGEPITDERILRHRESIKIAIVSIWPKGYCQNSREEFEALFNNGIFCVVRALTRFNRHDCLHKQNTSVKFKRMSDEEQARWKIENEEEAVLKGEKSWVMKALKYFYLDIRTKNSSVKKHGIEIPVDFTEMQNEFCAKEEENDGMSFGPSIGDNVIPMRDLAYDGRTLCQDVKQAILDEQMIIEIFHTEGAEAAHAHAALLKEDFPDRYENLEEFRKNRSQNSDNAEYLANLYEARKAEVAEEKEREESNEDEAVEDFE